MWSDGSSVSSLLMRRTNRGWCSSSSDGGVAGDQAPTFVKLYALALAFAKSCAQLLFHAHLSPPHTSKLIYASSSRVEARLLVHPAPPKRPHHLLAAYPSKRSVSPLLHASSRWSERSIAPIFRGTDLVAHLIDDMVGPKMIFIL
jgi:hypothetical protein